MGKYPHPLCMFLRKMDNSYMWMAGWKNPPTQQFKHVCPTLAN